MIQYGGSVKPGNIAELMAQPDIDGAPSAGQLDPTSSRSSSTACTEPPALSPSAAEQPAWVPSAPGPSDRICRREVVEIILWILQFVLGWA